jgi:NADH-quinone oxidoreductase subunit J
MDAFVFIVCAAIVLVGAIGVVVRPNPVHCALSLVMTLFGIAVLFIVQDASFLAAVQVIVYAGAIVVLFLFVIMLLGVDRSETLSVDPLRGQRPAAIAIGVGVFGLLLVAILLGARHVTGQKAAIEALDSGDPNLNILARALFSNYVFAFEVTSVLLVIAVVGTVILARRPIRRGTREVEPESRS